MKRRPSRSKVPRKGLLSIINDGYFAAGRPLQGQRRLFWEGGECLCPGYVTDSPREDVVVNIRQSRWVNVDDRCGIVFRGSGRTLYRNRHYFPVWRAVEDDLILSLQDEWQVYERGDDIASLVTLWCPEQTHQETARQELILHDSAAHAVVVEVDGMLCAGNFHTTPVVMPGPMTLPAHALFPLVRVGGGNTATMLHVTLQLPPREPLLLALH